MSAHSEAVSTPRRWRTRTIVIALLAALTLIAVGAYAVVRLQRSARIAAAQVTPPNVDEATGGYRIGSSPHDASLPLVVLYEDFQCVQCLQTNALYFDTLTKLADRGNIRLQVVEMTLWDARLNNNASTQAAIAVGCAATVDAYLPYRQALFATQAAPARDPWTEQDFLETLPSAAGLSGDRLTTFHDCVTNQGTRDFVSRVAATVRNNPEIATEVARYDPVENSEQLGAVITVNGKNPQVTVHNTTDLTVAWWKQLPPQQGDWMAAIQSAGTP